MIPKTPAVRRCAWQIAIFLVFPALVVALTSTTSETTSSSSSGMSVPLHTTNNFQNNNDKEKLPLTVLVHGLDSSSKTWTNTITNGGLQEYPCLSVDQRGSGYTPLGNPDDFSQASLIQDLHEVVLKHAKNEKIVLLGHSLGGRIVLGYAAVHPDHVAALIIEDMDIAPRQPDKHGVVKLQPYDGIFQRQRKTKEDLIQALQTVGYPAEFIEKGLATGRIEPCPSFLVDKDSNQAETSWWSHINPDFRKFCYQHVLSTTKGKEDCHTMAKLFQENAIRFPCHVLVAGTEGTVCLEDSIQEIKNILGEHVTIHRYPTAGHSIHSTAAEEYCTTVQTIIQAVAQK